MNSNAQRTHERLKSILGAQVQSKPINIEAVIKSDIMTVLRSYFVISERNVEIKIEQGGDLFLINVTAFANNIKAINYLK